MSNGRNVKQNSGAYTYDPTTGQWIPPSPSNSSFTDDILGNSEGYEDVPSSITGSDSSSKVDSKSDADKKYIEIELTTLTGELVTKPSTKTIRLNVNNTVEVLGVGKYLSGKYFVSSIKRTLSKDDGYTQTLNVLKNGFGDSLKKASSSGSTATRSDIVDKSAPKFNVNDTVKIVGDAIYSNGVTVPAWVKEKTLTVYQISNDGTKVLLMPINSWTYVRYVQKV